VIAAADGSDATGRALAVVDDVEIRFTMSKSHACRCSAEMAKRLLSRPHQAQPRRTQTKTPPSFGLRRARWGPWSRT
jgi:hypothetical protein